MSTRPDDEPPEERPVEGRLRPLDDGAWRGRPIAELRGVLEACRLLVDPVLLGAGVPRGAGRPVLLVPGFLASDGSLALLYVWLQRLGYTPLRCGFHFNVGCGDRAMTVVERCAEQAAERSGVRVAVIGHSRGGHFARALGARRPDLVSHVICIGAALQGMYAVSTPTLAAAELVRRIAVATRRTPQPTCYREDCTCGFIRDFTVDFPVDDVRLATIYSKGDGIVRWRRSIVPEAENREVTGSHIGLAHNRKTYRLIGELLAVPEIGRTHVPDRRTR
jgi:triacylglycerol lipase